MEGGDTTAMYTAKDGSVMNRVGSYVVQSLTENDVPQIWPAFVIVPETRDSLRSQNLVRIDFVMTDSTTRNV